MHFNKRGVSQVISTVLIVLIVLVLVSALTLALVPFVKNSFSEAESCFDVQYGSSFTDTRFSCYESVNSLVGFTAKINKKGINTVRVAVYDSSGVATVFDVKDGINPSGLGMLGNGVPLGSGLSTIDLPDEGQQLTYVAQVNEPVRAEIAPIVKKQICNVDDTIEFRPCLAGVHLDYTPPINIMVNVNGP